MSSTTQSIELQIWTLSRVLLKNDSNFPWLILVPQRENIQELYELASTDRNVLMDEIVRASLILEKMFNPYKLNVAALGNVVPQLHVHIIARFTNDAAWPMPIWGVVPEEPYTADAITQFKQQFLALSATI